MKSVNKVILIGTLGRDPELRSTATGTQVARFSIATNERFKDKGGEWQERTEWHNIVAWQRLAEIAQQYLHKGDRVYIEGALRTNEWNDKNTGEKRKSTEIIANDMVLIGGRREGGEGGGGGYNRSRGAGAPASRGDDFDQSGGGGGDYGDTGITDNDVPF